MKHNFVVNLLETICVFRWYTPPVGPDAEEYRMDHEKRGRAIIFNHEKYNALLNLTERSGTNTDKIILKQRFEKLKFDVDVYDDLTVADIKKHLSESNYDFTIAKYYEQQNHSLLNQ
jgi:hypothetical protein